ncbi:MAG: Ig-like domain-containing protein [Alistipes sp.]|nr:Ig-like domain-containing protein [Alistipes sp.]
MKIDSRHNFLSARWATAAVLLLFAGAFLSRCASIGSPNGGPKDTLAPVIMSVTPELNTTNFKSSRIYIAFDEYVQLKDQQKEIYTSPAMRKKPKVSLRGRGIHIEIENDSLEPNTTYAIEFGSSVVDNNESNPLYGLRYVFSTGGDIDSLVMSGYTEDSKKLDSMGRVFVYFFEADSVEKPATYDSTMFKYKPSKIARSQKNGIFIAQNLKPVDYRIYAFYDTNDNQAYEPSIDQVGFLDEVYNPTQMPGFTIWYDSVRRYYSANPQLYLRMFTDVSFSRQSLKESQRPEQHRLQLQFGAPRPDIRSIDLEGIPSDKIIIEPETEGRDTLSLWLGVESELLPDTIRGTITYMKHDSVRVLRESTEKLSLAWRRTESREQERERERQEKAKAKAEAEGKEWREPPRPSTFKLNKPSSQSEVNPEEDLLLEFATPLTRFDSTSFELLSWSEKKDTVKEKFSFRADSISPRKWRMHTQWAADRKYRLYIPTDALADITGEGNDSITLNLTVADIEKFATLKIDVKPRTPEAVYVIQLLDSSNNLKKELQGIGGGLHTINYVPVGDLRVRIIEDMNGNGKWDSGNMVERRQSERAEFYKNDKEEELFTTKTGWEFEFAFDMSQIFAPVTMQQLIERLDKREMVRLQKEEERRRKAAESKKSDSQSNNSSGLGLGSLGGMMGGAGSGSGSSLQNFSNAGR